MNLKQQILSYSGVNIINASVPFLMLPILTSYISPGDYGVLSMVQLLMLLSFPFVILNSQGLLTMEYSNLSQEKYKILVSTAILIPLFGCVFLELLFFFFSSNVIKYFQIPAYLLYLIPIFLFFQTIPTFVPIFFQAKKDPFNFGKFKISLTIANVLLSLLFVVLLDYGWEGRLFGIVGSFLIFSIIGIILLVIIVSICVNVVHLTPEAPLPKDSNFKTIIRRVVDISKYSPTPQQCERIRLR